MVRCVLSQLKPSELYILSCGKSLGLRPQPFPQLRMYSSSSFILYEIVARPREPQLQVGENYSYSVKVNRLDLHCFHLAI